VNNIPINLEMYAKYGIDGSSARVRLYDWLPFLESHVQVGVNSYMGTANNSARTIVQNPKEFFNAETRLRQVSKKSLDRVVISRSASPFSNGEVERAIMRRANHSAYDIDDAVMLPSRRLSKNVFSERRVFRAAASSSDVVIAGNDYLADIASDYSDKVVVVPSCVDPSQYRIKEVGLQDGDMRVVWIGSPSTEKYLVPLGSVFNDLAKSRGVRLTVISAGSDPIEGFDSGVVTRVPWSRVNFASSISDGDVGIMPLPDSDWERGKCAYKLLQYGASGLPVVGSPVGASRQALKLLGGFSATTPDDWWDALVHLDDLGGLGRQKVGMQTYDGVKAHYSFDAWFSIWYSAVVGSA
jgi:glycosyltransferase involved in cell wall biosynthesis